MKKNVLIFCIVFTSFSLLAVGYMNWNNSNTETMCRKSVVSNDFLLGHIGIKRNIDNNIELAYKVDNRFGGITKDKLRNVKSIFDFFSKESNHAAESYHNVEVVILQNDTETKISELGDSDVFNVAQMKLLQESDYSTSFYISASSRSKNVYTGVTEGDSLVTWLTIIPEKQAAYSSGYYELIEYLKDNSKESTKIIKQDKLQPGKVSFTVTKSGSITNVKLTSTSGYPSIDQELIQLVTNIPGAWTPATNSKGDKVDQELVFFFGSIGC